MLGKALRTHIHTRARAHTDTHLMFHIERLKFSYILSEDQPIEEVLQSQ